MGGGRTRSSYRREYGPVSDTPPASNSLSSLTEQISRQIITRAVGRTGVEGSRKTSLEDKYSNCLNQEPNLPAFPESSSKIWRHLFPLSIVRVQEDELMRLMHSKPICRLKYVTTKFPPVPFHLRRCSPFAY